MFAPLTVELPKPPPFVRPSINTTHDGRLPFITVTPPLTVLASVTVPVDRPSKSTTSFFAQLRGHALNVDSGINWSSKSGLAVPWTTGLITNDIIIIIHFMFIIILFLVFFLLSFEALLSL